MRINGECVTCEKRNKCRTYKAIELTCMLGGINVTSMIKYDSDRDGNDNLKIVPPYISCDNLNCHKKQAIYKIAKNSHCGIKYIYINSCSDYDKCYKVYWCKTEKHRVLI